MSSNPASTRTYGKIWSVVRRIPRGRVATYGQIAVLAGYPQHARLVGYALHGLPEGADVPWHRVIGSTGRISLPRETGAHALQAALLREDGVELDGRGRIALDRYQWRPRARRRPPR